MSSNMHKRRREEELEKVKAFAGALTVAPVISTTSLRLPVGLCSVL